MPATRKKSAFIAGDLPEGETRLKRVQAYMEGFQQGIVDRANAELDDAWRAMYALSQHKVLSGTEIPKVECSASEGKRVYSLKLEPFMIPECVPDRSMVLDNLFSKKPKGVDVAIGADRMKNLTSESIVDLLNALDEAILSPVHPDIAIKAKERVVGHAGQQVARVAASGEVMR